jgi:monoamine oxidase
MGAVAKAVGRYPSAFWPSGAARGSPGRCSAGPARCGNRTTCRGPTGDRPRCSASPGPDGRPAALFGFAGARAVGPGCERAVTAQLAQPFGPAAAEPETLQIQDWSSERWTAPPAVHHLADHSLFGQALYQRPALGGRLHWASTETAARYAGHIEGALAAAERAVTASLTTDETNACSR